MSGGYVDGTITGASKEIEITNSYAHLNSLTSPGTPLVLLDRLCLIIC